MQEVKVVETFSEPFKIMLHETEAATSEARFAMALVERWGMVAGCPDGEDSAGRAKLRLALTSELVERACATTTQLYEAMRQRGWLTECPTLAQAEAQAKEQRNARKTAKESA